jgi:molybdopterin molybdotransferase
VGLEDHAPRILAEVGELAVHGVALRPASPTGLGFLGGRPVFLLPGNPVSCLCAYDLFASRAVRGLGGRDRGLPYRSCRLPLARKIVSMVGRVDYARVRVNAGQVEPLAVSGASILSSTTRADGFVLVPADLEGYAPGEEVEVFLYDNP